MKGYILQIEPYVPVKEQTLVGCLRCRATWREERTYTDGFRINGPMYDYDCCEKCKTPTDKVVGFQLGRE